MFSYTLRIVNLGGNSYILLILNSGGTQMRIFIIGLIFSSLAMAQNNGPQLINWFAGADIVGTSGAGDAGLEGEMYVREFEFSAFSQIDQTYQGILTLSYHDELENEEEHMEIHEAFLFSSKLFHLANVKIGRFFMGFGRLNRFHRHDWIFTDAPMIQKALFGNEGAKDTGFEYKRNILSLGSTLTLGLTSGSQFNHTNEHNHAEGEEHTDEKSQAPTGYLRFAKFYEFSTTKGLEIGLNYISRHDAESFEHKYYGLDLIYKNRVGRYVDFLVQGEVWQRKSKHQENGEEEDVEDMGAYLYVEKGIDQHHGVGVRLDYYEPGENDNEGLELDGLTLEGSHKAVSLSYNYYNSEFMRTRLTIEHAEGFAPVMGTDDSYTRAFVQFVFNIGAHPAHVY